MMDHDYTNDPTSTVEINAWREAAIADGWSAEPTYKTEPIERAMRLKRDGYVVQTITRAPAGIWKFGSPDFHVDSFLAMYSLRTE